jgi:EAL domain-containing protein (putative c-di-GMP-specific phosphodiesterase class I)
MRTTAEGVETNEQLDIVKENGCNLVQGFLFDRPQPADIIRDILRVEDGMSRNAA